MVLCKNNYDLSTVKDEELTKQNVLKYLDEHLIFEYYFGKKIDLNESYVNPLREDQNPGCKFFIGNKGKLLFIDFAKKTSVVDCFGFVSKKYDCSFYDALRIINRDFRLNLGSEKDIASSNLVYEYSQPKLEYLEICKKNKKQLLCVKRSYKDYDLEYWQSYGISLETLIKYNTFAVETVFSDNKIIWRNSKTNPIYAYYFPNEKKKKIYRPLEKNRSYRFLGSEGLGKIYQGFDQLPETSDFLIITKSMKDVMVLSQMGYSAIAPNGEGYTIDKEFCDKLYSRFDNIILFYDNDTAGIEATEWLSEYLGLPYIYIPKDQFNTKDISDYVYNYGMSQGKELMNELLGA